jgi:hypothetical protein
MILSLVFGLLLFVLQKMTGHVSMIAEMLRSPFEPMSTVSNKEMKEIERFCCETNQEKHDDPERSQHQHVHIC